MLNSKFLWLFKKKPTIIPTLPLKNERELRSDLLKALSSIHNRATDNIANRCVFLALNMMLQDNVMQEIMSNQAYRQFIKSQHLQTTSDKVNCLMEFRDNLYNKIPAYALIGETKNMKANPHA